MKTLVYLLITLLTSAISESSKETKKPDCTIQKSTCTSFTKAPTVIPEENMYIDCDFKATKNVEEYILI